MFEHLPLYLLYTLGAPAHISRAPIFNTLYVSELSLIARNRTPIMRSMRKGIVGIIIGGVTFAVLLASGGPASAFTIFGFNFGSGEISQAQPINTDTTATEQSVGDQARNFLNDIVANANENTCLRFSNHQYEVCSAYIFNVAMADLLPYYKYANTNNASLARFVSYRLDSRYTGDANTLIRARVSSWPAGDNDVDVPAIRILSVDSSLATNTATLQTQETWRVTDKLDNTVYRERAAYHIVTMARVPSYVLHKWVVTNIQ